MWDEEGSLSHTVTVCPPYTEADYKRDQRARRRPKDAASIGGIVELDAALEALVAERFGCGGGRRVPQQDPACDLGQKSERE